MPLNSSEIINNRYRIIMLLGQGGYGAVYRAWDLKQQKACAIKENLEVSAELSAQFMREATTLSHLAHPNLPRVIDHFSLPGRGQYLVMEFIEGENLEAKLVNGGPAAYPQAAVWIGQIAAALEYLHSQPQPVIHRDIKPANIIITPAGRAMLVDFGLVKVYAPASQHSQGARGVTPGYSPPEQYTSGKTDARADLYSLGATLYTLLTGQVPPESIAIQSGAEQPADLVHLLNPQVPNGLSEVVQRAMQLDPGQRFQSASEFKAALHACLPAVYREKLSAAHQPDRAPMRPAARRANPKSWLLLGIGGGLVGILLLLIGAGSLWGLYTYSNVLDFLKTPTPSLTDLTPILTPILAPSPTPDLLPVPTLPPQPTEMPNLAPGTLFSDDFSDPNSGWVGEDSPNLFAGYQDGIYRIWINEPSTDVWGNPSFSAADTIIEVDTLWAGGTFDNDFGIICRYQDGQNFYFGIISSDGYGGIVHLRDGQYNILGAENIQFYDAIYQGPQPNHLRFDCVGSTLSLYANGQLLTSATEASLVSGQVGLIAGTFNEAGVNIIFDNFVVYQP